MLFKKSRYEKEQKKKRKDGWTNIGNFLWLPMRMQVERRYGLAIAFNGHGLQRTPADIQTGLQICRGFKKHDHITCESKV